MPSELGEKSRCTAEAYLPKGLTGRAPAPKLHEVRAKSTRTTTSWEFLILLANAVANYHRFISTTMT